jgi:multidrug efflux pump subunit AcrA (membrane-fusion protein)
MKRTIQIALIALMLLIGSAFLTGCQALMGQAQAPTPAAPVVQQSGAVVVEGHIVPNDSTGLFFMAQGTVSQVPVKEGQAVKKGDVLAQIGDRESIDAAAAAAQLELATAQRQLDDLNKNAALLTDQTQADFYSAQRDLIKAQQNLADIDTKDHQTRLDNATQTMNKAKDDLKTAQDDFDKVSTLDKDNATRKTAQDKLTTAQNTYDQAVRDHDLLANEVSLAKAQESLAEAHLNDAQVTRDAHQNGPDPADLSLANASLANAKAQLAAAQAGLAHLTLTAPYDGTVTSVDIVVGDPVLPNQPVMVIADLSKLYVETSDLTEKDVVSVRTGQKVSAVPDALPDLSLSGTVESIADSFIEKSGDITYVVRIPLDLPDPRLRWGMTVKVTFSQK